MNIKMTEYMVFSKVNTPVSRYVLRTLKVNRHCNSATYLMIHNNPKMHINSEGCFYKNE